MIEAVGLAGTKTLLMKACSHVARPSSAQQKHMLVSTF